MKCLAFALLPAVALSQLLGGITHNVKVDPTSEPVIFAVKSANEKLATSLGDSFQPLSLVEIASASTQVVAGVNYYLTLHLEQNYYCAVTVWYREWLTDPAERIQVTNGPTCAQRQDTRRVGGLAGGISDRMPVPSSGDTDDEGALVLAALRFGACASNDRSNNMFASTLAGDTSGATYTQQVTAGLTYRFYNVPLVETACRNIGCANLKLDTCHVHSHGMKSTCNFVIQSQPWMKPPYTLTDMSC